LAVVSLEELGWLARRVRTDAALTQAEVAERLSGERAVAQSHVSLAEQGRSKYASLAVRVIEEIGDGTVEIVYRVTLEEENA
jgi:transcriptional regulator with XRE-family HTH domain